MSKEDKNVVIVAAYMGTKPAKKNFDQLTQLVKNKKTKSDGMFLVQKDKEGKLIVNETGDHLGHKGAGWGGGVGLCAARQAPVGLLTCPTQWQCFSQPMPVWTWAETTTVWLIWLMRTRRPTPSPAS